MAEALMAFQIALINSPMLKKDMFEQAKECTKHHGFSVVVCMGGLERIEDSVLITRKFYQVPRLVFGILPISIIGSELRNAVRQAMTSEKGSLSILFMTVDSEIVLIFTCKEKDDEEFNRLVFASAAYKPDPVIVMWDLRYACEFHPYGCFDELTMCANCGSKENLSRCGACKGAYYCGRICQTEDWPEHKEDCPKMKELCVPKLNWF